MFHTNSNTSNHTPSKSYSGSPVQLERQPRPTSQRASEPASQPITKRTEQQPWESTTSQQPSSSKQRQRPQSNSESTARLPQQSTHSDHLITLYRHLNQNQNQKNPTPTPSPTPHTQQHESKNKNKRYRGETQGRLRNFPHGRTTASQSCTSIHTYYICTIQTSIPESPCSIQHVPNIYLYILHYKSYTYAYSGMSG